MYQTNKNVPYLMIVLIYIIEKFTVFSETKILKLLIITSRYNLTKGNNAEQNYYNAISRDYRQPV